MRLFPLQQWSFSTNLLSERSERRDELLADASAVHTPTSPSLLQVFVRAPDGFLRVASPSTRGCDSASERQPRKRMSKKKMLKVLASSTFLFSPSPPPSPRRQETPPILIYSLTALSNILITLSPRPYLVTLTDREGGESICFFFFSGFHLLFWRVIHKKLQCLTGSRWLCSKWQVAASGYWRLISFPTQTSRIYPGISLHKSALSRLSHSVTLQSLLIISSRTFIAVSSWISLK